MPKPNIVETIPMQDAEILKKEKRERVIIAGGGTGGHIYPGIAIAKSIQENHPNIEVHFVGAHGGLEEKIIPQEGFPLHLVPIGKLHSSVGRLQQLKTLIGLPFAFLKSLFLLIRLRPKALLGVGGFASGPIIFVASLLNFRTVLWEPNAVPGLANRLLARWVDLCLVVFKDATKHLKNPKVLQSGLPVRPNMQPHPKKRDKSYGPIRILVFGGSQGAHAINDVLCRLLISKPAWLDQVEIVHQTGPKDFSEINQAYKDLPKTISVFEYLHDMDARMAWADFVICRAGASTVAEICACEKAALFIPLPTAADNHQQKNAEVLAVQGAARIILQRDLSESKLEEVIKDLIENPERINVLEERVRDFQYPNAADRITRQLLEEGLNE